MIVLFEQEYLKELYVKGEANDKKHRFQPQIVRKYTRVIDLMIEQENVMGLTKYGGLHYEKLHGDKEGLSSNTLPISRKGNWVQEYRNMQDVMLHVEA